MRKCLDEGVLQSFCDGELSAAVAKDVTVHLTHCTACSASMNVLRSENELISSALATEFQSAVPTERLRQRIESAVAGLSVGEARSQRVSLLHQVEGWFAELFRQRLALGYASLVVMLAFGVVIGIAYFQKPEVPAVETAKVVETGSDKTTPETVSPTPEGMTPVVASAGEESVPQKTASSKRKTNRPNANVAVAKVKLLPGERSYLKTIANLNSTIKNFSDRPMRPDLQAEYERNLAVVDRALAAARSAAKKNPDDPDAAEFVYSAYQSKVDLLNTVADARVYNRQQ